MFVANKYSVVASPKYHARASAEVSWRDLHAVDIKYRKIDMLKIRNILAKSDYNHDFKTCVQHAQGEEEVLAAELDYFGATDGEMICGMQELQHLVRMHEEYQSSDKQTLFVCLGVSKWASYPGIRLVADRLNRRLQASSVGDIIDIVTLGEKDDELVGVCLEESTREALVVGGIPQIIIPEERRQMPRVDGLCVRTVTIVAKPPPGPGNTAEDWAVEEIPKGVWQKINLSSPTVEGFLPFGAQTMKWCGMKSLAGDLPYKLAFALWEVGVSFETEDTTEFSTSANPRMNLPLPLPPPTVCRTLFEVARRAHVSIVKKMEDDESGEFRDLFLFNCSLDMKTAVLGWEGPGDPFDTAPRAKRVQERKKAVLNAMCESSDGAFGEAFVEKMSDVYTSATEDQRGFEIKKATASHVACIIDCKRNKNVKGVLVNGNTVWYDEEKKLRFTERGVKVINPPIVLGMIIAGGFALTIWYALARRTSVGVESLIQTALAILALYMSTVVVIAYRLFHNGENPVDVVNFQQHIDSEEEWERLTEADRTVIMVRLLNEHPGGRAFVSKRRTSYVRDSKDSGTLVMTKEMATDNLFVAGFHFLIQGENLKVLGGDGFVGTVVQERTVSGRPVLKISWDKEQEALEGEWEVALADDWGYVV